MGQSAICHHQIMHHILLGDDQVVNLFKAHDHLGKKFGMLDVVERVKNDRHNKTMWKVKCECGNTSIVRGQELVRGQTTSCGCYHALLRHMQIGYTTRTIDLEEGQRFGRLKILGFDGFHGNRHYYKCVCDCGKIVSVSKHHLTFDNTRSCGCLIVDTQKINIRKNCFKPQFNKCKLCSKEFFTTHPNHLFCCRKHGNKFHNDAKQQRKLAERASK